MRGRIISTDEEPALKVYVAEMKVSVCFVVREGQTPGPNIDVVAQKAFHDDFDEHSTDAFGDQPITIREVTNVEGVPDRWRDACPWGEFTQNTIREILYGDG